MSLCNETFFGLQNVPLKIIIWNPCICSPWIADATWLLYRNFNFGVNAMFRQERAHAHSGVYHPKTKPHHPPTAESRAEPRQPQTACSPLLDAASSPHVVATVSTPCFEVLPPLSASLSARWVLPAPFTIQMGSHHVSPLVSSAEYCVVSFLHSSYRCSSL